MIRYYYGDDEFAIEQDVQRLRVSIKHVAYTRIQQQHPKDLQQALNLAITEPLCGETRLIWVEQCRISADLAKAIAAIPNDVELILSSALPLDMRLNVSKTIARVGEIRAFSLIPLWKGTELQAWVKQRAIAHGITIAPPAVEALIDRVGNQSRLLHQELEKLKLYAAEETVSADMVRSLCGGNRRTSLDLATALLNRRGDQAIALIQILQAEPSLKILRALNSQFRTWLLVKHGILSGLSDAQIAEQAGIGNSNRMYYLRQELNRINVQQIEHALAAILTAELAIKQGERDGESLKQMVLTFDAASK